MKPEDKINVAVGISRRYAGSMCIYLSVSHDPPEVMSRIINDMMYECITGQSEAWFSRSVPAKAAMRTACTKQVFDVVRYYTIRTDYKTADLNSGSMNFVTSIAALVKSGSIGYSRSIYESIKEDAIKLRSGELTGTSEFARAVMNDSIFNSLFS
jgi:hypothetical protein